MGEVRGAFCANQEPAFDTICIEGYNKIYEAMRRIGRPTLAKPTWVLGLPNEVRVIIEAISPGHPQVVEDEHQWRRRKVAMSCGSSVQFLQRLFEGFIICPCKDYTHHSSFA